jgi:TetR/AcrR family transcriptional regulator
MQRAHFIIANGGFQGLDRPVIKMLQQALEHGHAEGLFRRDIDVLDVHMLISSFCFFRINNQYTFAANFGRDLVDPQRRAMYRQMIGDVVVQYLTSGPD